MSFIDSLPASYHELKARREATKRESLLEWGKLEESESADGHDCDCEYCPYADAKVLSTAEADEIESNAIRLDEIIEDYDKTLKNIEDYAELMKVKL